MKTLKEEATEWDHVKIPLQFNNFTVCKQDVPKLML
jgi:hypothetical protein